ncbi:Hypothetical predicted protein [Octopus vulgaris]|uniref:Uncharacterized protein n=1 Tax=Octopus vulgaris TaxID=6645 RepID=A0AA36AJN3_OCTVU|nr:Hypothetical predicted protein [Octopus vulgaris]
MFLYQIFAGYIPGNQQPFEGFIQVGQSKVLKVCPIVKCATMQMQTTFECISGQPYAEEQRGNSNSLRFIHSEVRRSDIFRMKKDAANLTIIAGAQITCISSIILPYLVSLCHLENHKGNIESKKRTKTQENIWYRDWETNVLMLFQVPRSFQFYLGYEVAIVVVVKVAIYHCSC